MAAEVEALVLTASVDDPAAVRKWVEEVGTLRDEANAAFDRLVQALANRPHIAIMLTRSPSAAAEGDGAGTPGGGA